MTQDQKVNMPELEEAILSMLQKGGAKIGQSHDQDGVVNRILRAHPIKDEMARDRVAEAICSLVSSGLIYVSFSRNEGQLGNSPTFWYLMLTDRGKAAAGDQTVNPDRPEGYLEQFVRDIPQASETVLKYVKEALKTYSLRCHMACAVMLGVAAEAAFLELTESFCTYLELDRAKKKPFDSTQHSYNQIRREFMKRFELRKAEIPYSIREDIDIQLTAVFELIRKYRNDTGHPTGFVMDRGSCFLSLLAFAEAARRLYALKAFFECKADHEDT